MSNKDLVASELEYLYDGLNELISNKKLSASTIGFEEYLIAATNKSIRFTKSIQLLCEKKYTDEALVILRSLIELTVSLRWILLSDTSSRFSEYMDDLSAKQFGKKWTEVPLNTRLNDIGFEGRDYFDYVVKLTYSFAHVNAFSLNWDEVVNNSKDISTRFQEEPIYAIVVQMLGHLMKALDSYFGNGLFNEYNRFWEQIKVDSDIRIKINEALKSE